MADQPILLFYCQHSLGMGHLVRALTMAAALAHDFKVLFLNGGRLPEGLALPAELDIIHLPPLGMAEDNSLYSQDDAYTVESALRARRERMLQLLAERRPQALLIELFPFGRKKFASELLPLIRAAKRMGPEGPVILCSLRDIMVGARKDQSRHDERARWLIDRYFDAILVHADPGFVKLEDSFQPRNPLRAPVFYTGFVAPPRQPRNPAGAAGILVSAGGGHVGGPLLRLALEAQSLLWPRIGQPMTVVAGPFLPEAEWRELVSAAAATPGVKLLRSVPALGPLLAEHAMSLSQGGYNTVMDVLTAGIPALVVPFARGQEDEQTHRAERLERLGLLRALPADGLDAARLAEALEALGQFQPNAAAFDLDGAAGSARQVLELTRARGAVARRAESGDSAGLAPHLAARPA